MNLRWRTNSKEVKMGYEGFVDGLGRLGMGKYT